MEKCRLISGVFVFTLVSLFLSGCHTTAVKNSIKAELDGGRTVSEALDAVISAGTSASDTVTAAIQMGIDTQAVVKAAIAAGGDPLTVGNAAYNGGAILHDISMAGGATSGGVTGLGYVPGGVEQPTGSPASPR